MKKNMKKKSALMLAAALGLTTVAGFSTATTGHAEGVSQKYLVVFKQDTNLPAGYDSVINGAGGKVTRPIPQLGVVEVESTNPDFQSVVSGSSLVLNVNAENMMYPEPFEGQQAEALTEAGSATAAASHDLYNKYQWDIKQVTGNEQAWSLPGGTGKAADGKDIVVAVVDTGIDYTHPDLQKNYLYGKSFVPGISDPMDEQGHGTHVAGSIAGFGRVQGVGPDLKVAAYRVFGPNGGAQTADIAAALTQAADDNVDVINMSLGGYDWYQDPSLATKDIVADKKMFDRAIQYAINKGVTVVGSAGNNGLDITSPGQLTRDIFGEDATGSTHRSPSNQRMIRVASNGIGLNRAWYSNYGSRIDVTAPGGDYGPNWAPGDDYELIDLTKRCLSTVPGGYAWMIGTSMAAPKTAALAGLIIAQHGKDVLQPNQVKNIIENTAIDINKPGKDADSGAGLISAVNALK